MDTLEQESCRVVEGDSKEDNVNISSETRESVLKPAGIFFLSAYCLRNQYCLSDTKVITASSY